MGFDILDLKRGCGTAPRSKADEGKAVLKYIDVDDLVPSEDNFYSMSAIDELAGLIELSGGVKQPALVSPLGGGKYRVIAGHRRRLASIRLVKQGKDAYRKMPCMVEGPVREPDEDAGELRAIDEAILLITTNGQREKTDWDKVQEATRLRALLEQKRRFEKIPGETRKIIAEQLGTTPAQVGRYDSIEKHLIPRFKEFLADGKVNISVAYELSMLPEDEQCAALMDYLTTGALSIEDVKQRREKLRTPKPSAPERDELPPVQPGPPVKMVTADEIGPAPTPEQAVEILERTKDRPTNGAVVLPKKPEDEAGAPPVQWDKWRELAGVENGGKVVDFPAPPPPPPAPEPEKEPMHKRMAANILEDLQMYCEEMLAVEAGLADTWAERADALAVAIAVLRK